MTIPLAMLFSPLWASRPNPPNAGPARLLPQLEFPRSGDYFKQAPLGSLTHTAPDPGWITYVFVKQLCDESSDSCGIRIRGLFISAGHNYFGHHGQPAGTNPNLRTGQIGCFKGRGIRGDRFFDFKEDYKGQITFFSYEVFEALRRELNLPQADPSATRRNVLVSGIDLNKLIGVRFEIQGVCFEGVEECRPCYWMDSALVPGAENWLQGRGGLRARILTDGVLRCTRGPR